MKLRFYFIFLMCRREREPWEWKITQVAHLDLILSNGWNEQRMESVSFIQQPFTKCLPSARSCDESVIVISRNEENGDQRNVITCLRKINHSKPFFLLRLCTCCSLCLIFSSGLHVTGCFCLAGFSSAVTSSLRPSLITSSFTLSYDIALLLFLFLSLFEMV